MRHDACSTGRWLTRTVAWGLAVVWVAALWAGCAPVYVPNTINNPLLDEAGDVQVGGYLSTNGYDAQGAVAVSDQVGVMANVSYADWEGERYNNAPPIDFHRHLFGEVGVGYFTDFGRGRYDLYAGYGRGWAEVYDTNLFAASDGERVRGRYSRLFVQPSIGIAYEPVDAIFSMRIVRVQFSSFEGESGLLRPDRSVAFIEPAATIRVGPPQFKFVTQAGLVMPIRKYYQFDHQPFSMAFGVQVKLNEL